MIGDDLDPSPSPSTVYFTIGHDIWRCDIDCPTYQKMVWSQCRVVGWIIAVRGNGTAIYNGFDLD